MRATSKHLQIQSRSAKVIFILQMPRNIVSLFKRFGRQVFQIRTSSSCKPLPASVGRPKVLTKTDRKTVDKMPTLRKIKRAASRHTSQRFCSTFNFTQPHPKPTHHPTSGRLTI
jgi:hypothetical protein